MQFALDKDNKKIEPKISGEKAKCPCCGQNVVACVGLIKFPYWRHEHDIDNSCVAAQYENEGAWHNTWKHLFGKEFAEEYIKIGTQTRRADVRLKNGLVMEVQHSSIKGQEIQAREKFHKKMVWVFDASGKIESGALRCEKNYFHWIQPRISIRLCKCPVFLDLGYGNVFEIHEYKEEKYFEEDWQTWRKLAFRGTGRLITRDEFKERMIYTDIAIKKIDYNITFREQYLNMDKTTQLTIF